MKIVQVLPGSGDNFYCENCVRDNALLRGLLGAGQDVVAVPMYLPQIIEKVDLPSTAPLFFGGINAYLQQKSGLFRKTPRWFDRVFDSLPLLRLAARRAGSVRASDLGDMTLSMLKGKDGNQAKEVERLVQWLEGMGKPDVVHLSNPLLLGIGGEIKKRLGVPVVCTLQDEDTWIDGMSPDFRDACWDALAEAASNVDAFVAVSRYFRDVMREKMKIDADRLHVIHIGVDPDAYAPSPLPSDPPVLGFLARLSEKQGLGTLVDAFLTLKKTEPLRGLRLHLSGGSTADDKPYLAELRERLAAAGVEQDVTFFHEFDPAHRRAFLDSLTLLSVPSPNGVAFGTYILESLASGVPVVQPRVGSYPEIVEATGGGVLYEPNDASTLARVLDETFFDRERLTELGRKGRDSVARDFSLKTMTDNMLAVYRGVVSGDATPAGRIS